MVPALTRSNSTYTRRLTGDIVVVHGFDLNRTTNGVGLVHELTTDYVRSLDAGSWWLADFSGERVPLLNEVLAFDEIHFEIELKGHGKQFVENVLALVNDHTCSTESSSPRSTSSLSVSYDGKHPTLASVCSPAKSPTGPTTCVDISSSPTETFSTPQ